MTQRMQRGALGKEQRIAEILLYLFAAECVFGGSGRWLSIGSLSIRILLFICCFFVSLPLVYQRKGMIFRNPYMLSAIAFGGVLFLSMCLGMKNGNARGFIWADVTSFLTLALLPGMLAVIDDEKKFMRLLQVIFYASVFVAVVTTGLHYALAWLDDGTINSLNNWINAKSLGGFAILQTRLNRVYLRAQIFLQFSLLYGVWKIGTEKKRIMRLWLYFCEGMLLFAEIASYTRGFWIGLVCSAGFLLILEWKQWKKLLFMSGGILGITLMLAVGSVICYHQPSVFIEVVNRFDANLIVLTVEQEDEKPAEPDSNPMPEQSNPAAEGERDIVSEANLNAVHLRQDSLAALYANIAEHPMIGSGLGTNLDGIREDGKTEYMYQDMLMKMGVIGLAMFLMTFLLSSLVHILRRLQNIRKKLPWHSPMVRNSFLTAGYLGVAVTNAFNPYLSTPMGILMLSVVNLAVSMKKEKSGRADRKTENYPEGLA